MFRRSRTAPAADREHQGETVAADPVARGAAMHAARRGNRSARDTLAFRPADPLEAAPGSEGTEAFGGDAA